MRRARVIPVLLLSQRGLVKTRAFRSPQYLGDPINSVKIFNSKMADELILIDIEATALGRIAFDWIADIVSEAFMPVAYGGGLTNIDQCAQVFALGVEKVVINSAAVERPDLIGEIACRFGSQAVVVSIDARKDFLGRWKAYVRSGKRRTRFSPAELALSCERLGAGEIFLTSIERENSFLGYDIDLIAAVAREVRIPVVAHGGAGKVEHFAPAIIEGGANAVAAGSMFVFSAKDEGVLINYPTQDELKTKLWGFTP